MGKFANTKAHIELDIVQSFSSSSSRKMCERNLLCQMECFAGAIVSNAGAVPERPRIANSRASGKAGEADFEGLSEARGAAFSDRASNSMSFSRRTLFTRGLLVIFCA